MTHIYAWSALQAAVANGPVCLVRVEQVQGSAPREVGAWMAVTAGLVPGRLQGLVGSIGGGHLEYQAMERALQVLSGQQPDGVQRYALGPTLGQCCGGVVHLRFALVRTPQELAAWQAPAQPLLPVAVFGAGHVGQALVDLLQQLPCQTTWVDSRDAIWPPGDSPATVDRVQADPVQDAVADLSAGSRVVVLTHSHTEDWDIVAACLTRQREAGDLPFIGLIGSASKWASFRRRLIERGHHPAAVDAVHCPMGVAGVVGKEPAVIAVAVAAQLLQTRTT